MSYIPASSKGCCLNPKGWCFSAPFIIHETNPRKEDPGMNYWPCLFVDQVGPLDWTWIPIGGEFDGENLIPWDPNP